jgi:hypothetical protein
VFRCIYSSYNADFQVRATLFGKIDPLSPGEAAKAWGISTGTTGQGRGWEHWTERLRKAGGLPLASAKSKSKVKSNAKPRRGKANRR